MKENSTDPVAVQTTNGQKAILRRATGPRTKRGKAISSKNALKHGFLSKEVVIRSPVWPENQAEFNLLLRSYLEHVEPSGPIETHLVELAVSLLWRYRRLLRAEGGEILDHKEFHHRSDSELSNLRSWADDESKSEESRDTANLLLEWRLDLLGRRTAIPGDADIQKLQRYEAHLLRHFYRALNELERLQRMRLGDAVPAPVVVDVQN